MAALFNANFVRTNRNDLSRTVWYSGYLLTFLATGDETGGAFTIVEEVGQKGLSAEPPMHVHQREDESFYILEGRMRFVIGDADVDAPAGTLVVLPRGVPHRFTLESEHVRVLNMCTPAGFEGFFRALSEPAPSLSLPPRSDEPPDIARLIRTAAAYGVDILPPSE